MPRFGGILLEDYIERPDEKVGVFLRKRERRPQLDHIVMRSVGAGEDSALAQAVHHVEGLDSRGLAPASSGNAFPMGLPSTTMSGTTPCVSNPQKCVPKRPKPTCTSSAIVTAPAARTCR